MKKFKKPFLFSLALLPLSVISIWFVAQYQFELYDDATVELLISQIGSMELVMLLTLIQNSVIIFIACFLGYILGNKLGLLKPFKLGKKELCITGILSVISGLILASDYWVFGFGEPMILEATAAGMTIYGVIASILYGGIVEEILMRLFTMSFLAWIIWKLFYRKQSTAPTGVLMAANIISAFLFAAGHLPTTIITFGGLTPLLLFRCFLLNGGLGLVFGWLYRKHGLQYAMIAHAGTHIISKLIWALFI